MNRIAKGLIAALAISLLIHLLLFGIFPEIEWPDFGKKVVVLEARIVAPPKPVQFKPLLPPKPKGKPAAKPEKAPSPLAQSVPKPVSAPASPLPASSPLAQSAPNAVKSPGTVPMHAKLTFRVFRGDANVGIAVHTWDILEDGRYVITNKVGAIGIFALFVKGDMTQVSEGHVTEKGLRPDLYTITRGSAENRQEARFDWKAMKLDLVSGGNTKEVKLDPSTQDQLSFLYQFSYTPPKQGIFTFVATDGRKIDTYEYEILGEEAILSGTKKIRALHLRKLHEPGVEGTEIWLDEDHYYWPVQVSMTDRNGNTMRQVIETIEEK